MSFKKKANKALALLLSLSLAMSMNMPVSVWADETAPLETEQTETSIEYVKSGEDVIGIDLNTVPVIIQEAVDVSGNAIPGSFQLIHDADRDGIADVGEEKLAIDEVTEFENGLNIYGTYRTDAADDILITMNSGEVGNIYGSNNGDAENIRIVVNSGSAKQVYGLYTENYDVVSESVYIYVEENVMLTSNPVPLGDYLDNWSYYGDVYASWGDKLWVSDGYVFDEDMSLSFLELVYGKVTIAEGVDVTADCVSGKAYDNSIFVIKGSLHAQGITNNAEFVLEGGTFTGAGENSGSVYEPLYLEYSIESVPVAFYSGAYNTISLEEDGITKYYLKRNAYVIIDASLQGYDVYYSIDGGEDNYSSDGKMLVNYSRGGSTVHIEYVPKQISVANNYSAPRGVVGVTYTAEKPLVDLSIYPVSNDTEEGQVRYAVKKSTPLPEGLSLVKGKIIGTPKFACPEGQKVTVVVTGRNGTTADLKLTIKITGNEADVKSINETVFVDTVNKIIDLRGTSVVIMDDPDVNSSSYVHIYKDADGDGLPDNDETLKINGNDSIYMNEYELIGWRGIEDEEGNLVQAVYDGDIFITLKSGSVKKTYGVFGEGIEVKGEVAIYIEEAFGGDPVCGAYYGKAGSVTLEVVGGDHFGATIYGTDHAKVAGDVNYTFGKMARTYYNSESIYLTQYVTSVSEVGGDVNVTLGFSPNSSGLGTEGKTNHPKFAKFHGVSATKVAGNVNYTMDGKFTPGTFNMVEKSGDERSTVKGNLKIDWKSGTIGSPVLLSGADVEGQVLLEAEENADISGGYTYIYVCNDSSTADGIYVNIPTSCNGYVSQINNLDGYKSGLFLNDKGVVKIAGTYEIDKNLNATSMTVEDGAKVTIAENVTVEGLSLVDTGATVINNGTLKTPALSITGTVINREGGTWTVEGALENEGKIVNYGSFVQTYNIQNKYDKLGAVYTTMPLTLYKDPAEDKYALTGYSDLYYAVNVSWPTHCASAPVLTGTVTSGVEGDNNKYIRVARNGNGTSPFSLTPGNVTSDTFILDCVTYGPENTVAESATQEGVTTYSGNAAGMFEPLTITMNYKSTGNVTPITLEPASDAVTGLVVDKLYTAETPLYDFTKISIGNDISAENGKVQYSLKEGTLPDGIILKDGKLYGKLTTAAGQSSAVFTIKGLNQTTADFTLNFGAVERAVPQWEVPAALTATVGQTLAEVQLPSDARGKYGWVVGTDKSQVLSEAGTVTKRIFFAPHDDNRANYNWATIEAWDEDDSAIFFNIDIIVAPAELDSVTAPTGLAAVYGQTFADVTIPADENGSFAWDTEHHALKDFVGEVGEHTCYVVYTPNDKNYKAKSGIEVTLTVNPATPDYNETLTQVEVLCDEELGDVLLPDVDGGRYQWITATSTKPVDGEAYSVIYLPEDTINYDWSTVSGWHKYRKGVVFAVTAKITHAWDEGTVTLAPTKTATGKKVYECGLCDATKTEILDKLPDDSTGGGSAGGTTGGTSGGTSGGNSGGDTGQATKQPPKVGYTLSEKASKAVYKVSKVGKEVTYVKPNKKTYTKAKIPNTIKYEGVTYKVTAIANNAFKSNTKLKSVTIGTNIKTIGNSAFQNCTALKSVTIPKNVSKIGSKAFYGCKKLTKMTIKTSKLTEKKVGKNAFSKMGSSNYKKTTVKVPKKKLKAYKKMLQKRGLSKKAKVKK